MSQIIGWQYDLNIRSMNFQLTMPSSHMCCVQAKKSALHVRFTSGQKSYTLSILCWNDNQLAIINRNLLITKFLHQFTFFNSRLLPILFLTIIVFLSIHLFVSYQLPFLTNYRLFINPPFCLLPIFVFLSSILFSYQLSFFSQFSTCLLS